jgi:hypothetical protein
VATWSTKASTSASSCPKIRFDAHCCPAHIRQVGAGFHAYGGSTTGSLSLHLPALLAGPGSSGSADPSRRCQGCSHLPLRLQVRAAPCFFGLLRQSQGGSFHPTRLMAPHGAHSHLGSRSRPLCVGRFFTRGHSVFTQLAIASSLRSTARRAGRWRLHPIWRSIRHTCPG